VLLTRIVELFLIFVERGETPNRLDSKRPLDISKNPITPMKVFKEVIMKKSIMTFFVLFSAITLISSAAIAGSSGGQSFMGKIKSMFGEDTVFQHPQRLSKLIGSQVTNNNGEQLGKVNDLIADEDGRISYMILSRSDLLGMLGTENKLVAIPMTTVEPRVTKDGTLNINLAKRTLDQAPSFTASNYPDFSNKQWQNNVRGYFENKGTQSQPSSLDKKPENVTPKEQAPAHES
jgi:sporulation protein YlmC with PRC-barrel domain